jgi:ABC-type antimicrobial peptide transport system permease subunit
MAQSSVGAPAADLGRYAEQSRRRSRAARLLRMSARKPLATIALIVLVAIGLACLLAPVIAPYEWDELFT